MIYYFLNERIEGFAASITDAIPEAVELTAEQTAFFEANKEDYDKGVLTIDEVLNCKRIEVIAITPTPAEQRATAYAIEPLIEWKGKTITCDAARGLIVAYKLRSEEENETALTALYLSACAEVQTKYPD